MEGGDRFPVRSRSLKNLERDLMTASQFNKEKIQILESLQLEGDRLSAKKLAERLNIDIDTILFCLQEMEEQKLVETITGRTLYLTQVDATITNKGNLVLSNKIPLNNEENSKDDRGVNQHYDLRGAKFAGGFAATGNQSGGTFNDHSHNVTAGGDAIGIVQGNSNEISGTIAHTVNQSPEPVASEILQSIDRLSKKQPTETTAGQMAVAMEAVNEIENNPNWKQRSVKALKQGTLEVLKSHPIGKFVVGAIEGWKEGS